jgi:hypothetical protein
MSSDHQYRPLDLSAYRNATADVLNDPPAPVGEQQFQGLPFLIGPRERAFICLDQQPVKVAIDADAHHVIVAHRLLGSQLQQGEPIGQTVAEYAFRFVDGQQERVPIRERFEIADLVSFGQLPFLAMPDKTHGLHSRWRGAWSGLGYRQTEVVTGWPQHFYLWCWTNPRPDVALASVELIPEGRQVIVAAITLGLADEYPFVQDGAVPIRVELSDPALAGQRLDDLRVEVDRGVAGYAYPLPLPLAEPFAGWGEAPNVASSPTYVNVAATPSATLRVQMGETTLSRVRWADLQQQRRIETDGARIEIVEDGRNWVETVVLDDATNQPVPCRAHFRSIHGVPYQPHGHHGHVNSNLETWHIDVGGDLRLGQDSYAYIDGRCQGWLPRGEVLVDVARGYEYEPLRQRVTIEPGQRRLELRLRRWTDMNQQRWFSGDTHVHFLSTQGSLREARAEDLNVVNLLQSQWGSLFTNTEDFSGEPVYSTDRQTVVWANQENRQHILGHLILLGLKEPVYPWCSDGPSEAELGGTLETTLSHWADACHAQGGTVVIPHFPNPNGEPAVLVSTGRADAVEMIRSDPFNHLEYYRYLNAGYRIPLVGGTDKMSSEVAVGQYRTYVFVPSDEEFSYDSWCHNLRAGRTFLSGGPLLECSVDGAAIGDTVKLPASGGTVEVHARAQSILPIHTLQVIHNGEVVADTTDLHGTRELNLQAQVGVSGPGWICARVGGPNYQQLKHHDVWNRGIFAHTSPIYLACGDRSDPADRDSLQYMLTLVEGSLEYVRRTAPRHRHGAVTHHHGEADHRAYLERPFLEALSALRERL